MKRAMGLVLALAIGWVGAVAADDTWDGGAGDGLWSSGNNWLDNSAPATGGGGVITFNHMGLGSNNTVDADWTVTRLAYTNNSTSLAHTTTIASASTLLIAGGDLRAGYQNNNTHAAIQGGTVQIGNAGAVADVLVGVSAGTVTYSGNALSLSSSLNASNLRVLAVAKNTNLGGTTATLDMSGGAIASGTATNTLKAVELNVGGGRGRNPNGTLRLPPALTDIEVGLFEIAAGNGANKGVATLDFGSGAQLRRLTVTNEFVLGKNGVATLVGWPTGVTVAVGRAEAPVAMAVGSTDGATGCGATLAMTNGSFTAYLSSLRVGSSDGATGDTLGLLDLAQTAVQVGDEAGKIKVTELSIGGGAGRNPNGTLKLPTNITAVVVSLLKMGGGNAGNGGYGVLDFGANSALQSLTVSNGLYLGTDGQAALSNLPPGVAVTVGSDGAPAPMIVGCTDGDKNNATALVMTNGSFSGTLTVLQVGCSTTNLTALNVKGTLDLRRTSLATLSVTGDVLIGSWPLYDNTDTEGYVYLPTGIASCASNLYVGDVAADSRGWLELDGTDFRVGRRVEIGAMGVVSNNVEGSGCGLFFQGSDTNDFVIASGGRLAVVFKAGPASPNSIYWGLKMRGNVVDFMTALTNDTSRVRVDASALTVAERANLGVYYQVRGNFTYLGLPSPEATRGLVIILQ